MASKKILIQVDLATKSVEVNSKKVVDAINNIEGAQARLVDTTKKAKTQTGLNNAILLETGRLASDVNYGFSAIANNLGQLFTLFQSSAQAAGGLGKAIRSLFTIQAAFLIGVQLLISFLPRIIKNFKDKAKAARAVNNALIEGENAIRGQTTALETYIDILNDENTSLAKKENLLKEIKKQTGLQNLELDDNNKLSNQSNNLLKEKIRLMVLEAQANVIKNQIQEELTNRAKALDEVENDKNSTINKAVDFADRHTQGIQNTAKAIGNALTSNNSYLNSIRKAIPLADAFFGLFQAGEEVVEKYNEDVNSQTAIENRNRKAREESNKIISESQTRLDGLISKFKEITLEMLGINYQLGEFNDKVEELNIITFSEFMKGQDKVLEMTKNFTTKLIEDDFARKDQELINQEEYYLTLIDNTIAGEEAKEKARIAIQKYFKGERDKLKDEEEDKDRKLRNTSLKETAKYLNQAADLFGQHTAANKALKVASAIIDTYVAANNALAEGGPPPFNFIQAAAVIAAGIANVKKILEVKVPRESGTQSVGAAAPAQIEAPDFNVVGAGGVSQLATGLAGITGKPIQAFVVSKEISSAQELDRNITNNASLG